MNLFTKIFLIDLLKWLANWFLSNERNRNGNSN